jgi:hypothetical protein
MPNLRLGLSSDKNVGAPLPVSELIIRDAIERVKFIPYGAQVINLNYKDTVAFVDQDGDRICIHSHSTVVRSNGLRLPSFGIQSEADENLTDGCDRHISGAEHRARLLVSVPITRQSRQAVLQSSLESLARNTFTDGRGRRLAVQQASNDKSHHAALSPKPKGLGVTH